MIWGLQRCWVRHRLGRHAVARRFCLIRHDARRACEVSKPCCFASVTLATGWDGASNSRDDCPAPRNGGWLWIRQLQRRASELGRSSRVVALVNHYDRMCAVRSGANSDPIETLSIIFAQHKARFDSVVLGASIRMGSIPAHRSIGE